MFNAVCESELLNSSLVKQFTLSETMVCDSPVKENVCRSLVSVTRMVADTMWASMNLLCASTIISSMRPSNGPAWSM